MQLEMTSFHKRIKKQAYILKTLISKNKRFNEMPDGLIIINSSCTAHYMYQ
jgi:hypothetical protein